MEQRFEIHQSIISGAPAIVFLEAAHRDKILQSGTKGIGIANHFVRNRFARDCSPFSFRLFAGNGSDPLPCFEGSKRVRDLNAFLPAPFI